MFGRPQGGNLHGLVTENQLQPQIVNIDHLLPLPLQDFCLLRVISDLDGYPVELLASLPRWLRYRLLNNIPALDLCRLDHTTVATGIDMDQLWETRLQILTSKPNLKSPAEGGVQHGPSMSAATDQSLFQLDLPQVFTTRPLSVRLFRRNNRQVVECSSALKQKMTSVFNDLQEHPGMVVSSSRDKFLLIIESIFLYHSPNLENLYHLVSIPGEHLLSNLVFASHHQLVSPRHSYFVWRKQATPLNMQHIGSLPLPTRRRSRNTVSNLYGSHSCITPHRLVHSIKSPGSNLQLLSLLVNDCGVQPTSANICVNKISQDIMELLYAARVARENGFKVTADSTTCISIMHRLLSGVVILKLQCKKYAEIGVVIEIIEAITADQEKCQLQYLFCCMPDLYADVVHPLSTVFSLQNFSQLSLDLDEVYLPSLGRLLFSFLTAACPGAQQLCIFNKGKAMASPTKVLPTTELATMNMKGMTIPHCAIQHKMLQVFPQNDISSMLYILLQWPTVRLNELILIANSACLHLCALHPDLQVRKLVIIIDEEASQEILDTIKEDLVALMKIPTLEEFAIAAFWDRYKEAKAGVVQGLTHRSKLPPLRKIHINEAVPGECTEEEYRELWKAIFSLPQLDQLEIVCSAGAKGVLFKYLNTVFGSWVDTALGAKLKAIEFQSLATSVSENEVNLISHFTQTYSFLTYEDLFKDSEYHP